MALSQATLILWQMTGYRRWSRRGRTARTSSFDSAGAPPAAGVAQGAVRAPRRPGATRPGGAPGDRHVPARRGLRALARGRRADRPPRRARTLVPQARRRDKGLGPLAADAGHQAEGGSKPTSFALSRSTASGLRLAVPSTKRHAANGRRDGSRRTPLVVGRAWVLVERGSDAGAPVLRLSRRHARPARGQTTAARGRRWAQGTT